MPVGDWQFWVVTAAAVVGVVFAVRALRGRPHRKPTKVDLTVEKRRV